MRGRTELELTAEKVPISWFGNRSQHHSWQQQAKNTSDVGAKKRFLVSWLYSVFVSGWFEVFLLRVVPTWRSFDLCACDFDLITLMIVSLSCCLDIWFLDLEGLYVPGSLGPLAFVSMVRQQDQVDCGILPPPLTNILDPRLNCGGEKSPMSICTTNFESRDVCA